MEQKRYRLKSIIRLFHKIHKKDLGEHFANAIVITDQDYVTLAKILHKFSKISEKLDVLSRQPTNEVSQEALAEVYKQVITPVENWNVNS